MLEEYRELDAQALLLGMENFISTCAGGGRPEYRGVELCSLRLASGSMLQLLLIPSGHFDQIMYISSLGFTTHSFHLLRTRRSEAICFVRR